MAESKGKDIKDAIIALVEGIQLDGEPAFLEVKGHPWGQFDGYPSVRVLPADQSTEKGAFGQNDRTVSLSIRTHLPVSESGSEFDQMYVLTDLIMDALDVADFNNTFSGSLGTYVLNASRGAWQEDDTQSGPVIACDIDVDVSYSKNL